jgi:phospholipid-binding lipoprotein MlaA
LRTTLYGIRVVSVRASLLDASDLLASAALDKYSFVRNTYLQRRQYMISDGDTALPTYDNGPADDTAPAKAPPPSKAEVGTSPGEADGQSNTTGTSPSNSGATHGPTSGLQMMPPGRYYTLPGPLPK